MIYGPNQLSRISYTTASVGNNRVALGSTDRKMNSARVIVVLPCVTPFQRSTLYRTSVGSPSKVRPILDVTIR